MFHARGICTAWMLMSYRLIKYSAVDRSPLYIHLYNIQYIYVFSNGLVNTYEYIDRLYHLRPIFFFNVGALLG